MASGSANAKSRVGARRGAHPADATRHGFFPVPLSVFNTRVLATAVRSESRAMRKTRLADQRDDVHCMSTHSAVTLMKEAVDSAIKHGDIRLDAVPPHCLRRKTQARGTAAAVFCPTGCEGRRHVQAALARMDRLTVRAPQIIDTASS